MNTVFLFAGAKIYNFSKAGTGRVELPTNGLTVRCSTSELRSHVVSPQQDSNLRIVVLQTTVLATSPSGQKAETDRFELSTPEGVPP